MFKILIENKELKDYESLVFKKSFKSITATLSVNLGREFLLKGGEKIKLILNNTTILNGYIDFYSLNYGSQISTDFEARDTTGDVVDSTMRALSRKANYNFISLIQELTSLKVVNKTFKSMQISHSVNSSCGQNLFEFFNKIAKQLGVFLQADGNGGIKIVDNSIKTPLGSIDTYTSYTIHQDITKSFNRYTCYTQTENRKPSIHSGQVEDSSIRGTRFMVFESEFPIKTSRQAKIFANQKKALAVSNSRYIEVNLPFDENSTNIFEVGGTYLFKKEVVFLDEIEYNISSQEKNIRLKLINGDIYQ